MQNPGQKNHELIVTYLRDKYFDDLVPIIMSDSLEIYYSITVDLLAFIFHFPIYGSQFHEFPIEFIDFMRQSLIATQQVILEHELDEDL